MREKLFKLHKSKVFEIFCALTLAMSVLVMLYSFRIGGWTNNTFSALGRANPLWFNVFVVTLTLAIISNLWFFSRKIEYNGKSLYFLLPAMMFSAVTICLFNHEYILWIRNVHNLFSVKLMICSGVLLAIMLAYRHQRKIPYIAFMLLTAIISISSMFIVGLLVLNQVSIFISIMLVVFVVNYIDPPRIATKNQPHFTKSTEI